MDSRALAPGADAPSPKPDLADRGDRQSELLPLRIEAAALLDRTLRLKELLAAERKSAGARLRRGLKMMTSGWRRRAPKSEEQETARCVAVLLKSGLFDSEYYLRHYPDVAASGMEPVLHYVLRGAAELRSPGPHFSTRWYVERYPDIAKSGRNPLYHFILFGYAEGRLPLPTKTAAQLAADMTRNPRSAQPAFGPVAPRVVRQEDTMARSNGRLVVYSALFGNYDDLFLPPRELAEGCEFVLFTDQPNIPAPWQRGKLDYVAPSNARQNRFYKLLPHRLFPQHEWSLYLDANVDLKQSPIAFFERHRALGPDFFVYRHPDRTRIAEELGACIERRKDDPELMLRQVARYLDSGFTHRFPLTENNILLRRHNEPALMTLSEAWWEEVRKHSGRDQLSLSYVVEKAGYQKIGMFEDGAVTSRNSAAFRIRPHRHQFDSRDQLDVPFD